jgi:hypothetical protein
MCGCADVDDVRMCRCANVSDVQMILLGLHSEPFGHILKRIPQILDLKRRRCWYVHCLVKKAKKMKC